jgi:D-3-phosphoglycerate dehydrogenase
VNRILSNANIEKQICDSKGPIAYLMADINTENEHDLADIHTGLNEIAETIVTRILY